MIESEGVTYSGGVPTLWQEILQHARASKRGFSTLRHVTIGGSACSEAMFREFRDFGVEVRQDWGMTETGPVGAITTLIPEVASLSQERQFVHLNKAGRALVGVDIKVVDDKGRPVPHDGVTPGLLKVRGATIVRDYFGGDVASPLDSGGYFDTGDIVTVDEFGYIQITDRAKDLIKSGGEWISSTDVENLAADHPKSELTCVIGVPHAVFQERPIIIVKPRAGETLTADEVLDHLRGRLAKWWLPDAVIFVDEMPLGPTDKVDKKVLRNRFASFRPATAMSAS